MTPHQVLSLLTQEQTAGLLTACAQYLPEERIATALREGLEPAERRRVAYLLGLESELED